MNTQNLFIQKKLYLHLYKERSMNIININIETTEIVLCGLIFAILGFFLIFLHIPKDEEFKYYRQARKILGSAFIIMTFYCVLKETIPVKGYEYTHQCLLILFSLLFSWLNYYTFLTLIYSKRNIRKRFFLDGIIPVGLMILFAALGFRHEHFQHINVIIFSIIFGLKSFWMAYTCFNEYKKVVNDLENNYDQAPDIRWMYILIWMTLALSVSTLISFHVPEIHFIYDPAAIVIFVFMTVKMLNYIPRKISGIRTNTSKEYDYEESKEQKVKGADLKTKLDPTVEKWIEKKGFLQPDITIKDVAMEMGTNQNYLSRYINSVLGVTFSVWLNTLRIEESKSLLTGSEKISIEEVGQRVGIMEIYNFSRWFKTITGMTPQQYRKSHK